MKDGFIRVAAAAPVVEVANCTKNVENIIEYMRKAAINDVKLLVLPEHCITGYALGDLFLQQTLLAAAEQGLTKLVEQSINSDTLCIAGLPVKYGARLYSCAAAFQSGRLLGIVPKRHIPNYAEFYEVRHFSSGTGVKGQIKFAGFEAPFGADIIFSCDNISDFKVGVEICEDLWVPVPPSCYLAQAGATLIANISASTYVTGKEAYRSGLVTTQSARCIAGYVYASSGEGESTTDLVFSGHLMTAENGRMLNDTHVDKMIITDIDTELLMSERRKMNTFADEGVCDNYRQISFIIQKIEYDKLLRPLSRQPFVPVQDSVYTNTKDQNALYKERCREVLDIQSAGLAKRLKHTRAKSAVVAVSGGLDSTLALLVTHRAITKYAIDCKISAITMPGPGTTARTKGNAVTLCEQLKADLRVISISGAVSAHLADIGHTGNLDTAYENVQARERTQVAMDIANMENGFVVGTGDMSELALGFTTYNGDHMSMYGVNCGVPKTLVRHLIKYIADENTENTILLHTLYDILDTPVSPELLPAQDGKIAQKTEQIIGPYELHDFFLYYFVRFGFSPKKILRLANLAFNGEYEPAFIKNCLIIFIKRFFTAQFKRSCLPDGPKVGSVALSPRGDWRMPSDAVCDEWLRELE
jgi:NAD+ synthase (glutamine-hydrolysing)